MWATLLTPQWSLRAPNLSTSDQLNSTSLQVDVRKIDNTAVLAKQLERLQAS